MNSGLIAGRYARAIFEVALDKGVSEELFRELYMLEIQFANLPVLSKTMENPKIAPSQKRRLLINAIYDKPGPTYRSIVSLIVRNRRGDLMRSIALLYMDIYRKHQGIKYVELTLPSPVEEETREEIVALVASHQDNLELKVTIDPAIMGGFILLEGTRRLDASVRTSLRNIKRVLTEKNVKKYV